MHIDMGMGWFLASRAPTRCLRVLELLMPVRQQLALVKSETNNGIQVCTF